ncbi:hypothetical protein [Acinetobacter courvalinii]|uniref:hypothetical protein n=1 Tax=Acinetobacter courvalinii TaxID=280147 RepID=UPI0002CEB8E3|nr:hypothetical protein [Acinetobacter courvalinii]ENX07770.1 hypothetical protein F898_01290 [Acinetobacter courvalinii]
MRIHMKIIILLVTFIIILLFYILRWLLSIGLKKDRVTLLPQIIAHEWLAAMPRLNSEQQSMVCWDLIKDSFEVVHKLQLADYSQMMKIIDKTGFNSSNFVQLTLQMALKLEKEYKVTLDGFELRSSFDKSMTTFFSKCLFAVLFNIEIDGNECLERLASESRGSQIQWYPI